MERRGRYPAEVRERAVRLGVEQQESHPSQWAAITSIAAASDVPEIVTILVPTHEPTGPFGAKAIAEIPIAGPAPAIANAVAHAVGRRFREIPLTPDRVLAVL